jgi:Fic family protein
MAFDADGNEIGALFETATPFDTPQLMAELVRWIKTALAENRFHPLLIVAVFIVVLLEIHPFQDGNGGLSRILSTLLLLRSGYAYVPYSSLESVIEQAKDGYYIALCRTQGTIRSEAPDWEPWVSYFLRALQQQKRQLEKKLERERIVIDMLPDLSVQILELAKDHGRLTIGEAVKITGANRNTVKKHLHTLVASNHLSQNGIGKGTWYSRA